MVLLKVNYFTLHKGICGNQPPDISEDYFLSCVYSQRTKPFGFTIQVLSPYYPYY